MCARILVGVCMITDQDYRDKKGDEIIPAMTELYLGKDNKIIDEIFEAIKEYFIETTTSGLSQEDKELKTAKISEMVDKRKAEIHFLVIPCLGTADIVQTYKDRNTMPAALKAATDRKFGPGVSQDIVLEYLNSLRQNNGLEEMIVNWTFHIIQSDILARGSVTAGTFTDGFGGLWETFYAVPQLSIPTIIHESLHGILFKSAEDGSMYTGVNINEEDSDGKRVYLALNEALTEYLTQRILKFMASKNITISGDLPIESQSAYKDTVERFTPRFNSQEKAIVEGLIGERPLEDIKRALGYRFEDINTVIRHILVMTKQEADRYLDRCGIIL